MKHVGKAINKFRKINGISIPLIAKKTGIKIAKLNDFLSCKITLSKKDRKAICKVIDVAPEIILMESLEVQDVSKNKQAAFKAITPTLNKWITELSKDIAKEKAKKKK